MPAPYRFADYELHLDERRLMANGKAVALGGRAFDVLRHLVERRERPVPKDELLDAVWPGQDVEEGNLPVHISALRKLLGPQAIATVPGRGYRFTLALHGDALADAPAPTARQDGRPMSNLPLLGTPLLGRDEDLAALERELPTTPLLSLVGAAGIGKTRLALALAQRQQGRFADGVWWLDAAPIADATGLVAQLAALLQVSVERAQDPQAALLHGLRHRQLLLLLDNCEHLIEPVASLVQAALSAATSLRWLITSTAPLKLPLELVVHPPMLALPPRGTPLATALGYGALALLDERARATDRRFALTEATAEAAIDICHQLDGHALAIEMAASRVPWMGVESVRSRLGDRLRLLATHGRHANSRHRSLQAALDWSHAGLSDNERAVFRRLAVFSGGFTLEAAVEVGADDEGGALDRWAAIDALGGLVDKSLVHIAGDRHAPQLRYRLLESMRLYAGDQLGADEREVARRRHAAHFAGVATAAMQRLWHEPDRDWIATIEAEQANLQAALEQAVSRGDAAAATPLFDTLMWIGKILASGHGMKRWHDTLEGLAGAGPHAPALLLALASSYRNLAPERTVELGRRGLAVLDGLAEDKVLRFRLNGAVAVAAARAGQAAVASEALAEVHRLLDTSWPARLRLQEADASGFVAAFSGDPAGARPHFQRFHDIATACGAEGGLVMVSHNLTDIALSLGEVDEAVRLGREAVARLRLQQNSYHLGFSLGNLCGALTWGARNEEAMVAAREALPLLRREESATWLLDHLMLLAAQGGRLEDAARLLGNADARREAEHSARDRTEQRARDRAAELISDGLPASRVATLREEGARLPVEQVDRICLAA